MLFVVWLYRHVFGCCRRIDKFLFAPDKKDELVSISTLPWLWVGAKHEDGMVVDHTVDVNNSVEYGLKITPEWLSELTGSNNVVWKYLDAKTLEQVDFPSDGFVIDDPIERSSEDESDTSNSVTDDSESSDVLSDS
jgi:hypothetical protein